MEVNFDGLRRQTINSFNGLIQKLNDAKVTDREDCELGKIVIHPEEIEDATNWLRNCIVSLACLEQENEFKSLFDKNPNLEIKSLGVEKEPG